MAWDDCFTVSDYDRYMGYDAPWERDDEEPDEDEQPAETGEPDRDWRAHLNDELCPF
jgi:hypothetical protein